MLTSLALCLSCVPARHSVIILYIFLLSLQSTYLLQTSNFISTNSNYRASDFLKVHNHTFHGNKITNHKYSILWTSKSIENLVITDNLYIFVDNSSFYIPSISPSLDNFADIALNT